MPVQPLESASPTLRFSNSAMVTVAAVAFVRCWKVRLPDDRARSIDPPACRPREWRRPRTHADPRAAARAALRLLSCADRAKRARAPGARWRHLERDRPKTRRSAPRTRRLQAGIPSWDHYQDDVV